MCLIIFVYVNINILKKFITPDSERSLFVYEMNEKHEKKRM